MATPAKIHNPELRTQNFLTSPVRPAQATYPFEGGLVYGDCAVLWKYVMVRETALERRASAECDKCGKVSPRLIGGIPFSTQRMINSHPHRPSVFDRAILRGRSQEWGGGTWV